MTRERSRTTPAACAHTLAATTRRLCGISALALTLAACGDDPSEHVLGTWEANLGELEARHADGGELTPSASAVVEHSSVVLRFADDGTFVWDLLVDGDATQRRGTFAATGGGALIAVELTSPDGVERMVLTFDGADAFDVALPDADPSTRDTIIEFRRRADAS